jgi:hypothetical protein
MNCNMRESATIAGMYRTDLLSALARIGPHLFRVARGFEGHTLSHDPMVM